MHFPLREKIRSDVTRSRQHLKDLGPGLITGGAGDDPAGIVTYTIVGATTGFSQLWLLLLATPMMIAIQNLVARIALVTGKSLPEITKAYYSKKITVVMIMTLAIANLLTIGADLNAIAAILHMILGYKTVHFLILITAIIAYLITFGQYKRVKQILIGLTALLVVYIIAAILAKPSIVLLIKSTFVPQIDMSSAWIIAALGMLGTTISPYLLFWQASEEKEEKKSIVQAGEVGFDTIVGMAYSNLLAYAMIVTGAVMLYGTHTSINDVSTLAQALRPAAGDYAFALFAGGIIVAGFLAIPVLAGSTAYAVADTFGWREGMDDKVSDAKGFYVVFLGALVIGDIIDIVPNITVVEALYYSQVLDGILIPVLIGYALVIGNNKAIMGEYVATRFQNVFSLVAMIVTLALTAVMVWQWIS